ncbi:MAG: hypothetical protein M1840_005525 [Geoglossum simile]|nr:MAG: hypothetical protein M1840_005525 [Geoglossum simile]
MADPHRPQPCEVANLQEGNPHPLLITAGANHYIAFFDDTTVLEYPVAPQEESTITGLKLRDSGAVSERLLLSSRGISSVEVFNDVMFDIKWKEGGISFLDRNTKSQNVRTFQLGSLMDMEKNSSCGCQLCMDIRLKLKVSRNAELSAITISVYINMLGIAAGFEVQRYPVAGPNLAYMFCTEGGQVAPPKLWDPRIEACPLPEKIALSRKVSEKPDSRECFDLARMWLEDCTRNHAACIRSYDSYLPTRVIDVGPSDGSQEPYLYISNRSRGKYVTLSHCWGKSERLVTTTANLADHMQRIVLSDMAPTFRDAVTITRELGLRYLWIDCFCILQDSIEDWRIECTKMTGVYENSYVTIAVMDSNDSSVGIFQDRRRVIWPLYPNQTDHPTQLEFGITPLDKRYFTDYCLESRAWVYQEEFLSPAILKYSNTQIGWACSSYGYWEDIPITRPQCPGPPSNNHKLGKGHLTDTPFFEPLTSWVRSVSEYTRRELTIKSDRLLAFSAMIEVFAKAFNLTPLAGLWYEDLHRCLLWFRCKDKIGVKNYSPSLRQPRQPSWSWVAVDDKVQFFHWPGPENYHSVIRTKSDRDVGFINAHVLHSKIQTREDLQSGSIELYGHFIPASFSRSSLDPTFLATQSSVFRFQEGKPLYLPCLLDIDVRQDGSPCYCLPIASWTMAHELVPDHECMTYYLVLERSEDSRKMDESSHCEIFRRIGIGYAPVHDVHCFFGSIAKQILMLI